MFEIYYHYLARKEFDSLDGSQKIFVSKGLEKIKKSGMNVGVRLQGGLNSCNKLKSKKQGMRIVFRQVESHIEVIEIVAIRKRDSDEVYRNAIMRLK